MTTPTLTRRGALLGAAAGLCLAPRARATEAGGAWTDGPPLPLAVQEIYPAVLDGTAFVVGGLTVGAAGLGISDRVFSWRPGAPGWGEHAPLPVATHHANCLGHDGRLLALGGFTGAGGGDWTMTAAVWRYDPATDAWEPGPDLPAPQAEAVSGLIGGRVHLAAGRQVAAASNFDYGHHGDTAAHLVLEPGATTWTPAAPLPSPRNSAAGAVLDGRLHVVGGRTLAGGNTSAHDAYLADEDRWQALAPLPVPAAGPRGAGGLAMAALGGRLHVFGGEWFSDGRGVYHQVWSWSPATDAWEEAAPMPMPRHGLGAVAIGDQVLTIAGATRAGASGTTATVQLVTPPAG